jgi:hypothetical protein
MALLAVGRQSCLVMQTATNKSASIAVRGGAAAGGGVAVVSRRNWGARNLVALSTVRRPDANRSFAQQRVKKLVQAGHSQCDEDLRVQHFKCFRGCCPNSGS